MGQKSGFCHLKRSSPKALSSENASERQPLQESDFFLYTERSQFVPDRLSSLISSLFQIKKECNKKTAGWIFFTVSRSKKLLDTMGGLWITAGFSNPARACCCRRVLAIRCEHGDEFPSCYSRMFPLENTPATPLTRLSA